MTEITGVPAGPPVVDLACAFGLGFAIRQSSFLEELAFNIIPPVRDVPGGVEVSFAVESEEAVRRYVESESRRRPELEFTIRGVDDAVVLSVQERSGASESPAANESGKTL